MSFRGIALVASTIVLVASIPAAPLVAATPDVGFNLNQIPAPAPDQVALSPWIWEPDGSDSLRITIGTVTRRVTIRTWRSGVEPRGVLIERVRRSDGSWRVAKRLVLSPPDLAGGSTEPTRTRYVRKGFLSFDAQTMAVENNGGLGFTVMASAGQRYVIRYGAHDADTGRWISRTRNVRL